MSRKRLNGSRLLSISLGRTKTKRPAGADPARASIHQELDKSDNIEGGRKNCFLVLLPG
jgi:hypothetical protein